MAVFMGTFENKVDRKGRISVPATFRQVLAAQTFPGIVAFPSHRAKALEACGFDFMEQLNENMTGFDLFSDPHDDLAFTLFADTQQLAFDSEGRIVLPPNLAEHAGITDRAAFVGKGKTFQIWEPEALYQQKAEARSRAQNQGLTLPMRPSGGDGQ